MIIIPVFIYQQERKLVLILLTENFKRIYGQETVRMNEFLNLTTKKKMKKKELFLRNLLTFQIKKQKLFIFCIKSKDKKSY